MQQTIRGVEYVEKLETDSILFTFNKIHRLPVCKLVQWKPTSKQAPITQMRLVVMLLSEAFNEMSASFAGLFFKLGGPWSDD